MCMRLVRGFVFDDSCMTYVPYKVRYGDKKAGCIR